MIAGHSAIRRDVPPFMIAEGEATQIVAINKIGLQRHGVSSDSREALRKAYKILFRSELNTSEALERIARHVDETMLRVEERTGTVDSQDVALLTALNLAREVVEERDMNVSSGADPKRLRALIELAESALSTEAG